LPPPIEEDEARHLNSETKSMMYLHRQGPPNFWCGQPYHLWKKACQINGSKEYPDSEEI